MTLTDELAKALQQINDWCSDAQPATEGARLCAWHARRISGIALTKYHDEKCIKDKIINAAD